MDYLQEAKDNYKDAKEAVREQYERIKEDFRFSNPADPQQWDSWASKARQGRPTHTLDRTNQFVQHVVNKHRESKTSADILPADSKADVEVAKRIKGIIRHIEYVSRADIAWDTASDHQARGGLGWVRVLPKVVNPETNEQEIIIQRVHDPLSCVLDPNSTEPDGSDAMFGFVESSLTKTAFKRLHKKAKETNWDSDDWFGEDFVRIAEYFRVIEEKQNRLVVLLDGNQTTLSEDEYWNIAQTTGVKPQFISNFEAKKRSVKWCKLTGAEILEETEFPSQWIGIVPVIGHEIWIEGKRYLCGLVRRLMDGQKLHNYEMSALTEALMVQPKAPFLVPGRALEGYEDDWAKLNSGNPAYLPYNDLDTDSDKPIASPQRLSPPNFPVAYANTANLAVQEMEAAVGMYKATFGQQSNSISGRAKLADKEAGETATYHFADNRRIAQQQVYRIVVDMLPRIYDSRRQAKIMGEDGEQGTVEINPDLPGPVQREGKKVVAINPGVGRYDVRVKVGPSYTTIREEVSTKLQELGKGNPVLSAAIAPIVMQMSEMPDEARKIERIMLATLPPEIQKAYHDTDDADIPPQAKAQIDMQGQQIQQMSAAMDQAGKVIQDLQSQLNEKGNTVKAEAQSAMKEIQLAQEKLKNEAATIQAEKQLLEKDKTLMEKDKTIFQLQLKLDLEQAVNTVKEARDAEDPEEPETAPVQQPVQQPIQQVDQSVSRLEDIVRQAQTMMATTMTQSMQQISFIGQQMAKVEEKIDGSKAETVEKIRDSKGKLIGARIKQADGSVREVQIQ